MSVAVSIDPDLCIGSGDCVRIAPAAFELDDAEGVSHPTTNAAGTDVDLLLEAARSCPTLAIAVGDEGLVRHRSDRGRNTPAQPR